MAPPPALCPPASARRRAGRTESQRVPNPLSRCCQGLHSVQQSSATGTWGCARLLPPRVEATLRYRQVTRLRRPAQRQAGVDRSIDIHKGVKGLPFRGERCRRSATCPSPKDGRGHTSRPAGQAAGRGHAGRRCHIRSYGQQPPSCALRSRPGQGRAAGGETLTARPWGGGCTAARRTACRLGRAPRQSPRLQQQRGKGFVLQEAGRGSQGGAATHPSSPFLPAAGCSPV